MGEFFVIENMKIVICLKLINISVLYCLLLNNIIYHIEIKFY